MITDQTEIDAKFVYAQKDDEVVTVGFADQQYATSAYLMLQRTLHPSSDEVRLGHDKIHIEVNDELRSAYGGVKSVTLISKRVSIEVDAPTANCLRTRETIYVNFESARVDVGELAGMLTLVCDQRVPFHHRP